MYFKFKQALMNKEFVSNKLILSLSNALKFLIIFSITIGEKVSKFFTVFQIILFDEK